MIYRNQKTDPNAVSLSLSQKTNSLEAILCPNIHHSIIYWVNRGDSSRFGIRQVSSYHKKAEQYVCVNIFKLKSVEHGAVI